MVNIIPTHFSSRNLFIEHVCEGNKAKFAGNIEPIEKFVHKTSQNNIENQLFVDANLIVTLLLKKIQ